ncbi:hypothetical protein J6590_012360 [Homalodisca vitripennis]|nr:hypothetical protein J6590_012360 [Homalodisca vitripennis]
MYSKQEKLFSELDVSLKQVEKEKSIRNMLQQNFEEHDNEQRRIITSCELKITALEKKLSCLTKSSNDALEICCAKTPPETNGPNNQVIKTNAAGEELASLREDCHPWKNS